MWNFVKRAILYFFRFFKASKAKIGAGSTNFVSMIGHGNTVRDNTMIVASHTRYSTEYFRRIAMHPFPEHGGHRSLLVSNIGNENIVQLKILVKIVQNGILTDKLQNDFIAEKDETAIARANNLNMININERKKVLNIPRSDNGRIEIKVTGVGAITGKRVDIEETFDDSEFDA